MRKPFPSVLWSAVAVVLLAIATDAGAFDVDKSYRRGNSSLGATVGLSAWDTSTPESYTVNSSTDVTARVLGTSVPVVDSTGSVTVTTSGLTTARLRLVSERKTLLNYARSFDRSTSFVVPSYIVSAKAIETKVWAGPVPIKVKGIASVSLTGSGSVEVIANPPEVPRVSGRLVSVLNAAARGTARAYRDVASVSVKGNAKLANARLVTQARLYPGANPNEVMSYYQVDWSLAKAEGNMSAVATVNLPLIGQKTYSTSLGRFLNSPISGQLAKGGSLLP